MNSFDGAFECDADAGVTVPEPRGVNVAAAAAFGEMPIFLACVTAGCAASVLGVKEGDSTLKDFFGTPSPFAGVIADEKSWLKGQVPS